MKWILIILVMWSPTNSSPSAAKKSYLVTDRQGKTFIVDGAPNETEFGNRRVGDLDGAGAGDLDGAGAGDLDEEISQTFADILSVLDTEKSERFADILTGILPFNVLRRSMALSGDDYNVQKEGGVEAAEDAAVASYLQHLSEYLLGLGCPQGISDFSEKYVLCKEKVKQVLVDPNTLVGAPKIANSKENFEKILAFMLTFTDDARIESTLLRRSALGTFELRPDTSNVSVSVEKIFPEIDCRGNNGVTIQGAGSDYSTTSVTIELQEDKKCSVGDSPECKMNYFREDSNLNAFHFSWHTSSDSRYPKKEGKIERFYYMHKVMVDRYLTEREVLGLPPLKRLDVPAFRKPLLTEYTIFPESNLLKHYCSNKKTCGVPEKKIKKLRKAGKSLKRKMRKKDATIHKIAKSMLSYHAYGHNMIGNFCKDKNDTDSDAIMKSSIASARDPVFYRWHAQLEHLFQKLWAKKGYETNEVLPPKGIVIEEVYVTSKCGKNVLATYNELIVHDVKSTKKKKRYQWANTQMKSQLNHIPFEFNIRFKNELKSKEKLFVRIFLGLDKFSENLQWFTEMDRFALSPSGQLEETIARPHNLSSLTVKDSDNCGWPQNLFLPRGSEDETAPPLFRLIALIHKATSPDVNEGEKNYSTMLCGTKKFLGVHMDQRHVGFPINRAWNGLNKKNIINNEHSGFGNISALVKIHHYGYSDTKCEEKDGSQSYRSLRFDLQSLLLNTAMIRITTTDDSILTVSTDHLGKDLKQVLTEEVKLHKSGV